MTIRKNKILISRFYNCVSLIVKCIPLLVLIFSFSSCQEKYDPELMTPDMDDGGMMHGYNYTPLGCLLAYPWEFEGIYYDSTNNIEIENFIKKTVNEQKKDLIFELQRDGSIKYWFKSDYIVNPIDTAILSNGQKSITRTAIHSNSPNIKHIYSTGNWKANFKDSTIKVDFGKNDFQLIPFEGKISLLNADEMCIIKRYPLDIISDRKKTKIQVPIQNCFMNK